MIAKTEEFIRKNIAGQKTKQAQSRRKMLEKLDRLEGPEDVWGKAERVAFRFAPAARSGDIVLDAKDLAAERGGRTLFCGFELLVRRGERIGVVGPNGAGKSTLLKLLAGRGAAGDEGSVKRGTNLQEGYFDQHLGDVDPTLTAVDNVRTIRADFTVEAARQYLARFRFWGDDPLRVVRGFSGGERSRLALAKLLLEPKNLLFLDEPTNHLDIPAAEILEEALVGFEGTVLLVSHDRRFLENVTTRIVAVRDGEVETFLAGFRDYEKTRAAKAASVALPPRPQREKPKGLERRPPRATATTRRTATRPPGLPRAPPRSASDASPSSRRRSPSARRSSTCCAASSRRPPATTGRSSPAWPRTSRPSPRTSTRCWSSGPGSRRKHDDLARLRAKAALVATLAAVLAASGAASCKRRDPDGGRREAVPRAGDTPSTVVKDDSAGLLLTWIDDKGDFHVETKVTDVPMMGRDIVRVSDPTVDETAHGDRVVIADLRQANGAGLYPVRFMPRADFEALALTKREKAGPTLAGPGPQAPSQSGPPAAGGQAPPGAPPGARTQVVIYGAEWCSACHDAARYLRRKGVPYVEKDIEKDADAAREMQAKLTRNGLRAGSIPVIDVRGKVMVGFNAGEIDAALGAPL